MKTMLMTGTAILICASFALAQPPGGRGGGRGGPPPGNEGPGQAVMQALDADGNHEVSAEEIANASEALKKLDVNGDGKLSDADVSNARSSRGDRAGQGDRAGRGSRGNRSQHGDEARGRRGGPPNNQGGSGPGSGHGPPSPKEFVTHAMEFDADGDGKLSKAELEKFAENMRPPAGGEGGGRHGRAGSQDRPQRPQRPSRPEND